MPKALSAFHSLIVPRVLGVPVPLLDQALVRAAAEFTRETGLFQEVSAVPTSEGVGTYDVDVPSGASLSRVVGVWHGDRQLAPAAVDDVVVRDAFDGTGPTGTPSVFFQATPTEPTITIYPRPAVEEVKPLTIRAQFEIAPGATSLPDFLYANYAYEIAAGAIAYLCMVPGQSFTNPQVAATERAWFDAALSRGKAIARTGQIRRPLYVRPRSFP